MEDDQGSTTAIAGYPSLFHKVTISPSYSPCGYLSDLMARCLYFSIGNAKVKTHPVFSLSNRNPRAELWFRFYCWGPAKPPMEMSTNEQAQWHAHMQTPVLFNHHAPISVDSATIQHVNLNEIASTPRALQNQERVLILTPLRDAAPYLSKYFDLISDLTYPHDLIDLAFLVGDSSDDTLAVLSSELDRVQKRTDKMAFRSALVVEKDFGFVIKSDVQERHGFAAQGPRRKAIGRARNYLLYTALKPEHSWVYWRDVDIQDSPKSILEDFVEHNKDILVPSKLLKRSSSKAATHNLVYKCL